MDIKPWLVVVVELEQHTNQEHKEQVLFFDTHADAVDWVLAYPELTCIVCSAIALFGPKSGVGIDSSVELRKSVV